MNLDQQERILIMLFRLLNGQQKEDIVRRARDMSADTNNNSEFFVSEKREIENK